MHRFFGDLYAYDLFNGISVYVVYVASLFLFKWRKNNLGLLSKYILRLFPKSNQKTTLVVEFVLTSIESLLFAFILKNAATANKLFGDTVGTGKNYFGLLLLTPILWTLLSLLLVSNPLKQIDNVTVLVPLQVSFFKIACFFTGCCWGIEWEYGPYNYHPNHPGNQVPVQAIECLLALAIFVILLFYRKKARTGTMYPMYMIIYSATRFPVEFFSAAHEKILGPFNTYHFLCIAGIMIGFIWILIIKFWGEKITAFFEKPQKYLDDKFAKYEDKKALEPVKKAK